MSSIKETKESLMKDIDILRNKLSIINKQLNELEIKEKKNKEEKEKKDKEEKEKKDKEEKEEKDKEEKYSFKIIDKNILDHDDDFLVQQCNCTGKRVMGLSQQINNKFGVNPYKRKVDDKPGTYKLFNKIVCLFAQINPGKPSKDDSKSMRLQWFKESLELFMIENKGSIAISYKIGCGYGGGDWNNYEKIIKEMGEKYNKNIKIYKHEI